MTAAIPQALLRAELDFSTELDDLIFAEVEDSILNAPLATQTALTQRFVSEQYRQQVQHCAQYAAFVQALAPQTSVPVAANASAVDAMATGDAANSDAALSSPDRASTPLAALSAELDLNRIPVIPTTAFKRAKVLSVPESEVAKWCKSSGTKGLQSLIARDRLSLERLLGSVRLGMGLIGDWYEHEVKVINLGPAQEDAGDIWISYVMSLVELLFDTDSTMNIDTAIAKVERALGEFEVVFLIGPPFMVNQLLDRLADVGKTIAGADKLYVITAGGWKKHAGGMVSRPALQEKMQAQLGMADLRQYRDCFNQVELNSVFFECDHHKKHIPPWVHAVARHPETLAALPDGETGLLSFLDASAISYPAFLVSDDVGVIRRGACGCGREAVTVEILRRVEGRASRGCALVIEALAEQANPA